MRLASDRVRVLVVVLLRFVPHATPALGQNSNSGSGAEDGDAPDCRSPHLGMIEIDADERGGQWRDANFCYDAAREVEIRNGLPAVLGCAPGEMEFSQYEDAGLEGLDAHCVLPLDRRGLQYTGQLELGPIQEFLKGAGVDELQLNVWFPSYGAAHCDPPTNEKDNFGNEKDCRYRLTGAAGEPDVILFSFGYDAEGAGRIVGILGLLLLSPLVMVFWFRRRARGVSEEAKPAIVFAFGCFLRWTAMGGGLVWWSAIDLLHADRLAGLLFPANFFSDSAIVLIVPWILLWLPPAAVYFLCLVLSTPIQVLRGSRRTRRQAVRQSFWTVARFVIPLSFMALGVAELPSGSGITVVLFMGAFFSFVFAARRAAKAYGIEMHAITSGELRDRAFDLAGKAGAKLNQLYVFPTETLRIANAFAHSANKIFLTDYLVKNLSKREVDAVIGHEMTHLRKRHAYVRMMVLLVAIPVLVAVQGRWGESAPAWIPLGPVFYGLVLLTLFFVSRVNEFTADAGAVKLTGDAEAMMTALARISRLNTMPIHWGKLDEKTLTHPSTMRRITRLARVGGISEARIPELLSQSLVAPAPAEVYAIPGNLASAGKVFSTQWKARRGTVIAWTVSSTLAALAAGVGWLSQRNQLAGPALYSVYVAGIALTIVWGLVLSNFLPMVGASRLEKRLRKKLEKVGAAEGVRDGLFVSLAPDSSPRIYEGYWTWDIGFLSVTQDLLRYWGEETRFAVPRERIARISLGPGPVGWLKTASVYVAWRDDSGGERVFNSRPFRGRTLLEAARQTRRLAAELEEWQRGGRLEAGSLLSGGASEVGLREDDGEPRFGQITSISPRAAVGRARLVRIFLFDTIIAGGMAVVFGLSFPVLSGSFPASEASHLNPAGGGFLYVLVTMWITRGFLLLPYWRFRDGARSAIGGEGSESRG